MTIEGIICTILTSGTVSGAFALWFKFKLQYSIKHEYDKNIEKYKNKIESRKKAELLAELLLEWLSFPESQTKLNKLTFEAFLWLPDEIAQDLSNLLAHNRNAPEIRDILLKIRKYLLDDNTNLESKEIIIFTQEHIKKLYGRAIEISEQNTEKQSINRL